MATLLPLSAIPPALVDDLLDAAFGADRVERTAYRIRAGADWLPGLSFAALDDAEYLVGTIQMWPVALTDPGGRAHPLLMVGPVAVVPGRQGEGFGKALISAALGALDPAAPLPQVLIGDAPYYGRWGFAADFTGGWRCPGPHDPARLLARCAVPALLPPRGMLGPWTAHLPTPGAGADPALAPAPVGSPAPGASPGAAAPSETPANLAPRTDAV